MLVYKIFKKPKKKSKFYLPGLGHQHTVSGFRAPAVRSRIRGFPPAREPAGRPRNAPPCSSPADDCSHLLLHLRTRPKILGQRILNFQPTCKRGSLQRIPAEMNCCRNLLQERMWWPLRSRQCVLLENRWRRIRESH